MLVCIATVFLSIIEIPLVSWVIYMSHTKELHRLLENHKDLYEELMSLFKYNEEQALKWLSKTKAPLCDVTPLSLIGNKKGKEKVMDMIYQIQTGDMS